MTLKTTAARAAQGRENLDRAVLVREEMDREIAGEPLPRLADGPRDPAVLLRVEHLLARVHEHAVAVDEALVHDRLVRLAAVVERDRVGPHVLIALAHQSTRAHRPHAEKG